MFYFKVEMPEESRVDGGAAGRATFAPAVARAMVRFYKKYYDDQ